jgi:hypothetical protein
MNATHSYLFNLEKPNKGFFLYFSVKKNKSWAKF